MRGLGRLILVGGEGLFSRSTNTYNLAAAAGSISRRRINSSIYFHAYSKARAKAFQRSSPLFPFSYLSQFGGSIQSTRHHTQTAARPEFTDNGKALEKGDIISLNDLLFTPTRNYLVKNNNQHVKAEELKGKVVILYFVPLSGHSIPYNNKDVFSSELKDVYNDLLPLNNNFEVVLVVMDDHCEGQIPVSSTTDPQEEFEDLFSSMPWTAVPFSDAGSRKRIEKRLFKREECAPPVMFVIDSTGMVLQTCRVWHILQDFGALGFPFSDERINFLLAEDDAAAKNPSLDTLLASPQRSYVISNKGDKVPIDTMKHKVVALYFYYVDMPDHYLTSELDCVCDMLAKLKKGFEVVVIFIRNFHVDDWEKSCLEIFKSMPWLALPFRDESCKRLKRIFKLSYNGQTVSHQLVIVGPNAEFVEPFGASLLLHCNISAYPFSREKLVELETNKVKGLKLDMLCHPNTVLRSIDGYRQVSFKELFGKRIMLVLEWSDIENYIYVDDSAFTRFAPMLKGRYAQTWGSNDEFEVIRIIIDSKSGTVEQLDLDNSECLLSLEREHADMGWLVMLASDLKLNLSSSHYWYDKSPSYFQSCFQIFAFDGNGRLVRKTMYPTFENMEFPFYAGSLEEETLAQLSTAFLNY
ncbi:hypothetical protein ACET3Z_016750 [Daucus carota]